MIGDEKQAELDKCRSIAFAAIDYSIENQDPLLSPEQLSYNKHFNAVWREQLETLYQEKALERMQKLLMNLTVVYKITADIHFVKYVKEKTGHDFDLFGNIHERIDKIIARKRIANRKERLDVANILDIYNRTSTGQENAALLINLQIEFDKMREKSM